MSGIAGIVSLESTPLAPDALTKMTAAMAYWGRDGTHHQKADHAGFAYFHAETTLEAQYEHQPCLLPSGEWLVAAARLDNRTELLGTLDIGVSLAPSLSDGNLLGRAYLHWGEAVVNQLFGDWAFAIWNPATRRLFLARDQLGNTSLYYHANAHYFAFASSSKALLALDPALHDIDDLYVAQVMLSWSAYFGTRSVHTQIQRLPPAHTLVATPSGSQTHLYWRMQEVNLLPMRSLDEAVEGFRFHFDRAVQSHLRTTGQIATTLSGGLDSGAVSVTAASLLAVQNRSLIAYTSVPLYNDVANTKNRFGNEWEMAAATAACAGIIDHHPLDAQDTTPLMGIEEMLWTHDAPVHGAGNGFWIADLLQRAKRDGASVLLTGQGGNATISWSGLVNAEPNPHENFYQQAKKLFLRHTPADWGTRLIIWKMNHQDGWLKESFPSADLVRRTHAVEHSISDPNNILDITSHTTPLEQRFAIIKPGRSIGGALWHESGAAFGIEVRDPTQDIRLVNYCLSIPDHLFTDPHTGLDRMVIRQAMAGRMPDIVRLNHKRGLQAADIVARVCADRDTLTRAIANFAHSPASRYLNLDKVRQTWDLVQQGDSKMQHNASLLLRAVMAGFFVGRPQYPRPRPIVPTFSPPTAILQP